MSRYDSFQVSVLAFVVCVGLLVMHHRPQVTWSVVVTLFAFATVTLLMLENRHRKLSTELADRLAIMEFDLGLFREQRNNACMYEREWRDALEEIASGTSEVAAPTRELLNAAYLDPDRDWVANAKLFNDIVRNARKKSIPIDSSVGEWRCRCKPDSNFDTSANPAYVSRCDRCGAERPKQRELVGR
jgi:hypothetical protein